MRIIAFDQNMTVKSSHLRNCENSNGSKGACRHRKYFSLCNISAQLAVCRTLQTEECNISRDNVSFQSSCVTSSGSALAMIIWYFISQNDSLEDAVFPQWNPINVSFCVYGNLPSISSLYMSFGTVLLISRRVTASSLTTVPINSLSAP